ncbi:MAG: histidine phosphatase family protein [Acidimicrobiales bacterium]
MAIDGNDLVLVRHGDTEWSRERRHTGRTDVALTESGRRQADALATILSGFEFARVLCSPRQRALETCRRTGLVDRAEIVDDAAEWDYGVYEGRTTAEIGEEIPGWSVWTHEIVGGESVAQVGARADRVIAAALAVEGNVAVFGHAHLLRILAARWIDLDARRGQSFVLDTASVSVLSFEREERVIARWNETGAQ